MPEGNGNQTTIAQMAGGIRGAESSAPDLVRPTIPPGQMGGYPDALGGAADSRISPGPTPEATEAEAFIVQEVIKAPELEALMKQEALRRLKVRGFNIDEASFYARAQVSRLRTGGVRVLISEG